MRRSSSRPLLSAVSTCVAILCVFLFLWLRFGVPDALLRPALFGIVLFSVVLLSVVVYQSMRIYESATTLAKDLTKNLLVYSHELFSELYRSSPVPYILVDERGEIESINFSAARLFHVEIEALNGINAFEFIDTDSSPKAPLILEYFKEGKFVNDVEVLLRRPDEVTRWVLLSLFSFKDAREVRKGLLTLVDITKQKMIDKAKTEFVSLASHQLRTPISAMKWNIELLETSGKDNLTELQRGYLSKVGRGLERMDTLVGDFLSASKFELGTLTADRKPLQLVPFFDAVYEEHRLVAEGKLIRIVNEWSNAGDTFTTDQHLLHMIVSNLLGNAVKYTRDAGTVTLRAESDEASLVITVIDTGIGIPEEDQEMIFSKLFRASNARSQVADGTGLGLYIVREAAKVLGGTVAFESKPGIGTTFIVTLPKI